MSTNLYAVQHIRRMRGGSQAHLMRASDGHYFVVKFQNNPQHIRVLANEIFATRLAQWLGRRGVTQAPEKADQLKQLAKQVLPPAPDKPYQWR